MCGQETNNLYMGCYTGFPGVTNHTKLIFLMDYMNRHGFECVLGHFLPKVHIFLSKLMLSCFVEKNVHLKMTAIINIFDFYTKGINNKNYIQYGRMYFNFISEMSSSK